MALSEREQKVLDQLEELMSNEDPHFASSMSSTGNTAPVFSARHLALGILFVPIVPRRMRLAHSFLGKSNLRSSTEGAALSVVVSLSLFSLLQTLAQLSVGVRQLRRRV